MRGQALSQTWVARERVGGATSQVLHGGFSDWNAAITWLEGHVYDLISHDEHVLTEKRGWPFCDYYTTDADGNEHEYYVTAALNFSR